MVRVLAALGVALAVSSGPAFGQTANTGQNFLGTTNTNNSSPLTPPDTMGSIGPNHFVQTVNQVVAIYTKGGALVSQVSEASFWHAVSGIGASTATSGDPRMLYDPLSQRWFASVLSGTNNGNSILIARSNTADPTKGWAGGVLTGIHNEFEDFPTLGVDANGVYVGTNNFSGNLTGVSLYAFPKADLLATTPIFTHVNANLDISFSTFGITPHGITNSSATAGTSGIISSGAGSFGYNFGQIRITPVAWAGTTATLGSPVNVALTGGSSAPPSAPQIGGNNLDGDDTRLNSYAWRVGNLIYGVHGTGVNGRTAAQWFVVNATNNTVVQNGTIADGTLSYVYPSIAANPRGDIVLGFTGTSSAQHPGVYAVVGTPNTPFNPTSWTFGTPFLVQAGEETYVDGGNPTRWGDYSATTLDPADPGIFWTTVTRTATQLESNAKWGSQVTEIIPTVAGEVRWKVAVAGDVSVGSNWFNGSAPLATDNAIFSRWSTASYAVTIPAAPPISYDRLSVRQTGTGTLSFALATGASLALTNAMPESAATPSLAVSEFQGQSTVSFTGGIVTAHTVVVAGQAGGVGTLRVENGATLTATLTAAGNSNVYIGGTASAPGGTGSLVVDGSSAAAAVNVTGTLKLWQNNSQATVTSATLTVGGLTHGTGTPTVTLSNSTASLVINGAGATTFGGVIAGAGTVTQSGTGTQTLTGANTYSGNTSVTQGTLALSGTGSIANSPTISLAAGATLDGSAVTGGANHDGARFALASGQTLNGNGSVAGPLGVRPGATLAPGTSGPGKLTVSGGLVFTGGTLQIAVTGPTPVTGYGQVEVTSGAINLGTGVTTLSLPSPSGTFSPTSEIVLIHGSGSATYAGGTFTGLPNGAALSALAGLGGQATWYIQYGVAGGTGLAPGNDVLATPVPEPAGMVTVVLAGLAATWRRRCSLERSTDRSA
jgi:autotransporter-associated beta strand protein